jgi:hypothetical protein
MDRSVASPSYHPIQESDVRVVRHRPPESWAVPPATFTTAATMAAIFDRTTARCCVGSSVERGLDSTHSHLFGPRLGAEVDAVDDLVSQSRSLLATLARDSR